MLDTIPEYQVAGDAARLTARRQKLLGQKLGDSSTAWLTRYAVKNDLDFHSSHVEAD